MYSQNSYIIIITTIGTSNPSPPRNISTIKRKKYEMSSLHSVVQVECEYLSKFVISDIKSKDRNDKPRRQYQCQKRTPRLKKIKINKSYMN